MKEKPPTIDSFNCSVCDTEPEGCPGCVVEAKEAQRDADAEWFIKSKCEHCDTPLLREGELYEKLKQARRETVYAIETLLEEEGIELWLTSAKGGELEPLNRVSKDVLRKVLQEDE